MKKKNDSNNEQEVKVIDSTEGESKPVEKDPNIILLSRDERERPFNEETEEQRRKLFKSYKAASLRNNIIMVVTVAAFIGSFIAITRGQIGQIIGWVIIGTTIVALVIYYILTKNTYPKLAKLYFYNFWKLSNEYLFDQDGFANCKIDQNEKYELATLLADKVYKDVTEIASRNIVRGDYHGKPFSFGEAALYKQGAKKRSRDVAFVGRYLQVDNKLNFPGRYVINVKKPSRPLDLPNDIEDLTILFEEDAFILYGEEGRNYEKELGAELVNKLKGLTCEGPLVNINIAIWGGRTVCYLSYEDVIVAIPFQSEIDMHAYESEKADIEKVFATLAK